MPVRPFEPFKHREVEKKHIKTFWKLSEKKYTRGKILHPSSGWDREVYALSPTQLVTVREFETAKDAKQYVENSNEIIQKSNNQKPKHYLLQPIQFFNIKGKRILERVYPGPSIYAFSYKKGRYYGMLKQRLTRRGIDLDKRSDYQRVRTAVDKAHSELIANSSNLIEDTSIGNFLVLDFNPETEQVLLGVIDFANPESIRT